MVSTESFYGLPKEVQFCKSCVISNQRPSSSVEFKHKKNEQKSGIRFSDDHECEACQFSKIKKANIDWDQREQQLLKLLDKYRRSDGGYDVVVPGSGGKDSAFTSHILKYKYGMNPLTVTWAPHLYTDIGWKNFQSWIHTGGLDNILFTPNGILHRHLTRLAFLNLLHPFQPFIIGQRIIGPKIAKKFGIQLVMYGENQAEYGNNINENAIPTMDKKFFRESSQENIVLGGVSLQDIIKNSSFTINDFEPYLPETQLENQHNSVDVHYLGYYLNWDPQECFYYAFENTGFRPNTSRTVGTYSKYSSIDDKIDAFHYYTTYIKFGLGRASYDASQEIRNDKIDREEGIALVKKYDDEFPELYFEDFLDYISLKKDDFFKCLDKFRSPHLWELRKGSWILRNPIWKVYND